jgi:hypothetical protein
MQKSLYVPESAQILALRLLQCFLNTHFSDIFPLHTDEGTWGHRLHHAMGGLFSDRTFIKPKQACSGKYV